MKKQYSKEELSDLFEYDEAKGVLIHKPRALHRFKKGPRQRNAQSIWNSRYAGTLANFQRKDGYASVAIDNCNYLVHRVIFAMHHGFWPRFVDHIDGDRANNKLHNLRAATSEQNNKNRGIDSRNTSGCTGVSWNSRNKTWVAQLGTNQTFKYLGSYRNFYDAVLARKLAERLHGFHPNHGKRMEAWG